MTRAIAGVILLAGLAIRLPGLFEPPLAFHATRQYHSAILARSYALDHLALGPAERVAAAQAAVGQPVLEPPIIEHLAAVAYRVAGRESLVLARLISVIAWIGGAAALWWLTAQLFGRRPAAIAAALAVFLFLPFSIPASQAFQPDALMTALTVLTLAAAVHHDHRRGPAALALLTVCGLAAILIKPMAVFFVVPAILVLAVCRSGLVRGTLFTGAWTVLAAVPAVIWYVIAVPGIAEDRWLPQLLRTQAYWLGWGRMIDTVAWWPLAVAGLIGVIAARGKPRRLLVSLWLGYIAFGFFFTHHIYTHNYYSLPLVPIVGLSVAALVDRVASAMSSPTIRRVAAIAGVAALTAGLAASIREAKVMAPDAALKTKVADYERIGKMVGHSSRVIALDGDYAFPLNYHGVMQAMNWPLSIDRAMANMLGRPIPPGRELLSNADADFFVATMQSELDGEPDVHRLLDERYPLIDRGGSPERWRYLVYDLRHPKFTLTPKQLSVFALVDATASSEGRVSLWTPPSVEWRVEKPADLLDIQPDRGKGPAMLSLVPLKTPGPVDRTIDVPIFPNGASTPSAVLSVRFRSVAGLPAGKPIGSVDGPGDPVILTGTPITFQGWALDDFDLRRIRVEATDAKGQVRTIGETRGTWKRPDVAAIVPNGHDIFNSGWVFAFEPGMLSSLALPVTLRFYAETGDGRRAEIGKRTVRTP
jgi:hypothetical protein